MRRSHVSKFKKQPTYGAPKSKTAWELDIKIIQPWSVPVFHCALPPEVLEQMTKISDKIMADNDAADWGPNLAGQIETEKEMMEELVKDEDLTSMNFFQGMMREFVIACKCQQWPHRAIEFMKREDMLVQMTSAWITSQMPGEYNPPHMHVGCHISAVMYIKIPKMLPQKKKSSAYVAQVNKGSDNMDGSILFSGNASRDVLLSVPHMIITPKVGDFFIFGAHQQHSVFPFRCEEGDPERRSISFNAVFQTREDHEAGKKIEAYAAATKGDVELKTIMTPSKK